jgi:hypothetical protein
MVSYERILIRPGCLVFGGMQDVLVVASFSEAVGFCLEWKFDVHQNEGEFSLFFPLMSTHNSTSSSSSKI